MAETVCRCDMLRQNGSDDSSEKFKFKCKQTAFECSFYYFELIYHLSLMYLCEYLEKYNHGQMCIEEM